MSRNVPTLDDIARLAGVNKTTVSKALRGYPDISESTRRTLAELALSLGYPSAKIKCFAPDSAASAPGCARNGSISQNGAPSVAIIVPELTSHFYSRLAAALADAFAGEGFGAFCEVSDFDPANETAAFSRARECGAAGAVCVTESASAPDTSGLCGLPAVIVGLNCGSSEHDVVSIDERAGVGAVAEHLLSRGFRKIAYAGDRYGEQRLSLLREALGERGIALPDCFAAGLDSPLRNEACGLEAGRRLLSLPDRPDAVFAEYDAIALGVLRAANELGLVPGRDVAVAGFDDAPFCAYLPVPLTSVNCRVGDMSGIIAAILSKKIREPGYRTLQTVAVRPELVMRASTGQEPGSITQ